MLWYEIYFNVHSKADMSQLNLPHGTNNLKVENRKKSKKGYPYKYRQTVRVIRGVSPKEKKEGYGGKGLQKRTVLSSDWKSEWVMLT